MPRQRRSKRCRSNLQSDWRLSLSPLLNSVDRMKKSNWLVLRAGMFALQITSLVGAESQSLFGGRTLDGWDPRGQAVFSVENGVIVGVSGKGDHGWLCSKKTYGDFILELEVKDDSGNSGIQVRSHIN